MYAYIHYNPSVAATDVLADIVAIATGETVLANLSAGVQTGDSAINTSISVAGWTLWDDVSSTIKVIRAPMSDDGTKYKYLKLEVTNISVKFEYYSTWNEVAHTGTLISRKNVNNVDWTNLTTNLNYAFYQTTGDSVMMLSINGSHFAAHSLVNGLTANSTIAIMSEHTRSSPWDTVPNGYAPVAITVSGLMSQFFDTTNPSAYKSWFVKPAFPNTDVLDYQTSDGSGYIFNSMAVSTPIGSSWYTSYSSTVGGMGDMIEIPATVRSSTKTLSPVIVPFGCHHANLGNFGGDISAKSGIYLAGPATGSSNDILVIGGQNYRIWVVPANSNGSAPSSTAYRFAVIEG